MSLKTGAEHMGVTPQMAALIRATIEEHYFRPRRDLTAADPYTTEKRELLAAWLGEEKAHVNAGPYFSQLLTPITWFGWDVPVFVEILVVLAIGFGLLGLAIWQFRRTD